MMDDVTHAKLFGRRILVAEDSYLLATYVANILEEIGARVVGPVAGIGEAVQLVFTTDLDGAVFNDVLRGGLRADPLAVALTLRQVPYVRLSLASEELIGGPATLPWPFDSRALLVRLAAALTR